MAVVGFIGTGNMGSALARAAAAGGSTIQGVRALEEGAFRATVMNAVIAAYEKEV